MATKKTEKKTKKTTLVIVESPAKAKTINKYLGSNYKVTASMGHIIDLPKSRIAVDVENNFEPEYITVRGKGKILDSLKKYAANSTAVLLASDNDREGEAIAFHIQEALLKKYPNLEIKRIIFNEITKDAIKDSIKEPRNIDINKIEAQKARRVLDRLVGYNISPILWEKVKGGLSAGRVQSITLKVICEREEEIDKFIPVEYWTLSAELLQKKKVFTAELFKINDKKPELRSKNDMNDLLEKIKDEKFIIESIQKSTKTVKPQPPFITSKLQQTAANRFNFTSRKTMRIAQQLYEGIDIGKDTIGLITYMRTDSTRISDQAINDVRQYISNKHSEHLPEKPNFYGKKSNSQDAHEAIRPTSTMRTPEDLKKYLTPDQFKIYSIIWEKFVSSQMTPAQFENETVLIKNGEAQFKATQSKLIDRGYNACLNLLKNKELSAKVKRLPDFTENEEVQLKELFPQQHFTQPPARYTDASIIKFLEENGIGRPSTYAPTISTLQDRYYVTRKAKQLIPTVLGKLVNSLIVKSFPEIVNIDFTANLERQLDSVANGETERVKILRDFYTPFIKEVEEASENLESHKKVFDQETDMICEKCGSPMVKKLGKYGFFIACSAFPECRNSKPVPLADCPKEGCDGQVVPRKKSPRGKEFYGCTNYPECDFLIWDKPTEFKCPQCGKFLVEKTDKMHGTYKQCVDTECGYKQLKEHSENNTQNENQEKDDE